MTEGYDPRGDYRPDGARQFMKRVVELQEMYGNAWSEAMECALTHTNVPPALAGPNANSDL